MIAQIDTLAISIKLSLRDDFKPDVHDVWSHKVSPYLRNWWSYLLWKVPNAVERSSREQREWIGERENRKRNQKSDEIYTFFQKTSAVDVFVSRRARTLEFFRWRRKHHISVQRWFASFLSLSLSVYVSVCFSFVYSCVCDMWLVVYWRRRLKKNTQGGGFHHQKKNAWVDIHTSNI